ncbi:MAG: DUF86 domain-containing protein [Candidatus Hydrogenedentes bacterium]|nr:DUF86 domain-containing protein [Candidatus Hydrogenedentota bacterium]
MLGALDELQEFTHGASFAEFCEDRKSINAVVRSLEVLGEAAKRIPQSVRESHQDVPWARIAGLRDKLIHGYFGVDLEIVWSIATTDAPNLRPHIERILLANKPSDGTS